MHFPALISLSAAALLLQEVSCQVARVTSDTFFYGQSEPVYPSPESVGLGDWAEAVAKATAFVANLTLEERTSLTGGLRNYSNSCGGNIPSIPRVGFPGLCLADAGNGVRGTDLVNAYASGIHAGARQDMVLPTYQTRY